MSKCVLMLGLMWERVYDYHHHRGRLRRARPCAASVCQSTQRLRIYKMSVISLVHSAKAQYSARHHGARQQSAINLHRRHYPGVRCRILLRCERLFAAEVWRANHATQCSRYRGRAMLVGTVLSGLW